MADEFIIAGGRQSGKSHRLIEWLLAGEQVSGYPGWSRVVVVPDIQQEQHLKKVISTRCGVDLPEWPDLDIGHRLYHLQDWQTAHGVNPETEVAFDNAEWMLPRVPGRVTKVSMTGGVEWLDPRRETVAPDSRDERTG